VINIDLVISCHYLKFGQITDMIWISHIFDGFKTVDQQLSEIEVHLSYAGNVLD